MIRALALVGGRYRLERELGRGGAGAVYVARRVLDDVGVALKLLTGAASGPRFEREVETLRRLPPHPGVVAILDSGRQGSLAWLALELVPGSSLAALRSAGRAFTIRESVGIVGKVLLALGHLHRAGVVHRDVTTGNVLLDASGEPRLVDFGLTLDVARVTRLTASDEVVGTDHALAPEQLVPRGADVGPAADLHAAAALLYTLLAGEPPFASARSFAELTRRLRADAPPPLDARNPAVSPELAALVARGLAKDPARRPAPAERFAEELRAALATVRDPGARVAPVPAPVEPGPEEPEPPAPGSPRPASEPRGPVGPGSRLGDHVLLEVLGEGGTGRVYRARDERLGREVAIKVQKAGRDAADAERFRREAEAASRVRHPHVVPVHGSGEVQGRRYIVTELVRGEGLDALARRSGRLEPRRVASIGARLARALEALHEARVLHRDVKPSNVLVDERGEPRLADFGIAKLLDAPSLTGTSHFVATPVYAPLEQLEGRGADARSDVYSLGATLHELAAGRPPFEAASFLELVVAKARVPDAPSLPGAPGAAALDAVLARALAPRPEDRFATAGELAAALEAVLAEEPPSRRPGARALLVAFGLAALGLAALGLASPARGPRGPAGGSPGGSGSELDALVAAACARPRPGEAPPVAALESAAAAALATPASVVLWGEREGPALGPALLDARDALLEGGSLAAVSSAAESLLARAEALGRAREDAAARALRAHVALARASAPRRALGPGDLARVATLAPEAFRDLEAARELPGRAGAEAAWLLAELLAVAGRAEEARAALDLARRRAPRDEDPSGAAARASLERALGTPLDAAGLAALLHPIEDRRAGGADRARAAREVAVFLARAGAPGALEHPELADAGSPERLLAREAGAPAGLGEAPAPALEAALARVATARVQDTGSGRAELRESVRQALALAPGDPAALAASGEPLLERATEGVFLVLAAGRAFPEALALARSVDRGLDRPSIGRMAPGEAGSAARACEAFDRRLADDLAADDLVALAKRAVPAPEVETAARAVSGLRRLEALETRRPADPVEAAELALAGLRGIEELARGAPGAALLFRARLRRAVFPEPLGARLALLDLLRLERRIREAAQGAGAERVAGSLGRLALRAAAVAATLPGGGRGLEGTLFELGAHLGREEAVRRARTLAELEARLEALAHEVATDPGYRALVPLGTARQAELAPRARDRLRVGRARYAPPPFPDAEATASREPPDSVLIAHDAPLRLAPGESRRVLARFGNVGATPWVAARLVPGDANGFTWSEAPAPASELLQPGGTATFAWTIVAPASGGSAVLEARLEAEEEAGARRTFGEALRVEVVVAGNVAVYAAARDLLHRYGKPEGGAWSAVAGRDDPVGHLCYGPYTKDLAAGAHEAVFGLALRGESGSGPVGEVDVYDSASDRVLARRPFAAEDFPPDGRFLDLAVGFEAGDGQRLEFRVAWFGRRDLLVDRVAVSR